MKNYNAVVIGCGNIGCQLEKYNPGFITSHLVSYLKNPKITLVAVCDINMEKAQSTAEEYHLKAYSNIKQMLKETEPDIVSVCTPDETHYPILKEITEYETVKGVWCEKPIAISMEEASNMVELCQEHNIKLLINHLRRYDSFYLALRDNMNRLLGDIQSVVCYYSGGISTVGSHIIDLLNFYFGKCISIRAKTSMIESNFNVELLYEHNNKLIVVNMVPCNNEFFSIMELNIMGTKARLDTIYKPFGDYDYRYYPTRKSRVGINYISEQKKIEFDGMERNFFENALQDLIDSIEKDKTPFSSGNTAIHTIEILSAIVYSANNNGFEVKLPFKETNLIIPRALGDIGKWKN